MNQAYGKIEKLALKKNDFLNFEKIKAKTEISIKEIRNLKLERDMWKEEAFMYKNKYEECLKFISESRINITKSK